MSHPNDGGLTTDAELMHDRGTNRGQFARGEVDHYSGSARARTT
jgi:hypothetical protein